MPRKTTIAILLLSLSLIFTAGFKYYELHTEKVFTSNLLPPLKNSSLRFSNAQDIILNPDSDRTYQNAIDEYETAIREIDNNILATQTLSNQKFKYISDASLKYQSLISDILRSEKTSIKENASLRAKMEAAQEANKLTKSSDNIYVMQRANKLELEALKESLQHIEEIKKSNEKSKNLLIDLQKTGKDIASILPNESLIDEVIINSVITKLSKSN